MSMPKYGINSATPEDWNRLRREHPAIEKPSIILERQDEDMVNSPTHYASGSVECIDAIKASMTTDAFKGYLRGSILKYIWRMFYKGKPLQDAEKAQWYLTKLISEVEVEATKD